MAWAIMGGLAVATVLTLVFLPTLYATWYRAKRPRPSDRGSDVESDCDEAIEYGPAGRTGGPRLHAFLSAGDSGAIDLVGAYEQALAHDPTTLAANDALTAGQEKAVQGRALLLPSVRLQGSGPDRGACVRG